MRKWVQTVWHGVVEVIFMLPFVLTPAALAVPHEQLLWWVLSIPMLYVIGRAVSDLLYGRHRFVRLPCQLIIPTAIAYGWFGLSWAAFLYMIAGLIAMFRAPLRRHRRLAELLPTTAVLASLTAYFFSSVFYSHFDVLAPLLPWMYACGVTTLVLSLFLANHFHLQAETDAGRDKNSKVNRVILTHNRVYLASLILIITIVAFLGPITRWLAGLRDRLVAWLNEWLSRERQPNPQDMDRPAAQPPSYFVDEQLEPSWWAVMLEKIIMSAMYVLFGIVAVFFLIAACRWLWRAAGRLAKWFAVRWNQRGLSEDRTAWGYEDEKETLVDWEQLRRQAGDRMRGWRRMFEREPGWNQLSDAREKMRYLYRQWIRSRMRDGYEFKPYLTPNETAAELFDADKHNSGELKRMVDAYNQARYGGVGPDEKTMESWRNQW